MFYVQEGMSVPEYSRTYDLTNALSIKLPKKLMPYFKGSNPLSSLVASRINLQEDLGYILTSIDDILSSSVTQPCDKSHIYRDFNGRIYTFDDSAAVYDANVNAPKICVDINGAKKPNRYGYD